MLSKIIIHTIFNPKGSAIEIGTLGVIGKGVVMVVYPEGVFYGNVKVEDIPELIEERFIKGRPLKRLIIEATLQLLSKKKR